MTGAGAVICPICGGPLDEWGLVMCSHDGIKHKTNRYSELWAAVYEHVQHEADLGIGPWILTAEGRAWTADRRAAKEADDRQAPVK
jgi:hypothetical protein